MGLILSCEGASKEVLMCFSFLGSLYMFLVSDFSVND